ncbi:MAG: hypothetical protein LBU64_03975 [Planctomycetota bacterium]|jgi:hypothetical protein|nr:hypothetical protein [Planctomycetota bacterium]
MLDRKGLLTALALLLAVVFLAGRARLSLDRITEPFRDDFREMLYMPRGDALKILSVGFSTPMADLLFIKSLIYYGHSFEAKDSAKKYRGYVHALFEVITDLSPRFVRAHQVGSLLLSSTDSLPNQFEACRLLAKGIEAMEGADRAGQAIFPEARWLFHTLLANIYETGVQIRLRRQGDAEGAARAREMAKEEFRLAAVSPEAPSYIQTAAAGYLSVYERGGIENPLLAILSIWREFREQAIRRGDQGVQRDMEGRIRETAGKIENIRLTRAIEAELSRLGRQYREKGGVPPASADDLAKAGLIPGPPLGPLEGEGRREDWLALPDGSFRSRLLAEMETENQLDKLRAAVISYRQDHQGKVPDLEILREKGYLMEFPEPPLGQLGQTYRIEANGRATSRLPGGGEFPSPPENP